MDICNESYLCCVRRAAWRDECDLKRVKGASGIDLGDKLTPANHEWNPKGFWEDNEIVYKVNARVLSVLGGSWDSVTWFDCKAMTDERLRTIKTFAANLLRQRFSETQYWGFKDPNTVKIVLFCGKRCLISYVSKIIMSSLYAILYPLLSRTIN